MTEQLSTAEWIQAALETYQGPLIRYAVRFVGDIERARDVVQDTFMALCAADRTAVEEHLAAWLFTVCRHRALDVGRKEKRMQPLEESTMADCPSSDPTPAGVLEQEQTSSAVLSMLAALPPKQQEVVRLKFQENLSYREISEITGHSITNVGFLIHTAIKTLRGQLQAAEG